MSNKQKLVPSNGGTPIHPNPNRLCADDGACGPGDSGCYRSDIILKLESEFELLVDGTHTWPTGNFGMAEGDFFYVYKPEIEKILLKALHDNTEDAATAAKLATAMQYFGNNVEFFEQRTMDEVAANIHTNPSGMPKLMGETLNFYKFQNVCTTTVDGNVISSKVDVTNMTKDLIAKIKNTFTPSCSPLIRPIHENDLYTGPDGNLYSVQIPWFSTNFSKFDFGFFVELNSGVLKFYPFSTLTSDQTAWVNLFGAQIVNV